MFINKFSSLFFSKKKKSDHKLVFYIYKIFTSFYSKSTAIIENIFLKNNYSTNKFYAKGIFKLSFSQNLNKKLPKPEDIYIYESFSIYKLNKLDIESLISLIFDKKTRSFISKNTGFNYSIDYFRIYENKHISKENNLFYKIREAHFDKAFSKNMLKIFIPLNINSNCGPLKVFHRGKYHLSKKIKRTSNFESIIGNGEYLYGVLPNVCWHQEGNPEKNLKAKQIMIQLNPSKYWQYRKDLYQRQLLPENKFPSFVSIFSKQKKLH